MDAILDRNYRTRCEMFPDGLHDLVETTLIDGIANDPNAVGVPARLLTSRAELPPVVASNGCLPATLTLVQRKDPATRNSPLDVISYNYRRRSGGKLCHPTRFRSAGKPGNPLSSPQTEAADQDFNPLLAHHPLNRFFRLHTQHYRRAM